MWHVASSFLHCRQSRLGVPEVRPLNGVSARVHGAYCTAVNDTVRTPFGCGAGTRTSVWRWLGRVTCVGVSVRSIACAVHLVLCGKLYVLASFVGVVRTVPFPRVTSTSHLDVIFGRPLPDTEQLQYIPLVTTSHRWMAVKRKQRVVDSRLGSFGRAWSVWRNSPAPDFKLDFSETTGTTTGTPCGLFS